MLERKKDYTLRAKDYHCKQDRLHAMQQRAAMRNPDEFYFCMQHAVVRDGQHRRMVEAERRKFKEEVGVDTRNRSGMSAGAQDEDDVVRQQRVFQEFMLRGKSKVDSNDYHHQVTPSSTPSSKDFKRLYTVLKAFRETLVRDWLDVDEQLHRVWCSVANLRERCRATSRSLEDLSTQETCSSSSSLSAASYRQRHNRGGLNLQDLELALSYNLMQHERMLAASRQLLLKLGQAQEALSRRLDEIWLLYHNYQIGFRHDDECTSVHGTEDDSWLNIVWKVEGCEEFFKATAKELFRKQRLADQVFDSMQDALLTPRQDIVEKDPVWCARQCASKWPCNRSESHLCRFETLLDRWRLDYETSLQQKSNQDGY